MYDSSLDSWSGRESYSPPGFAGILRANLLCQGPCMMPGTPTDPVPGAYYGHNFGQRLAGTVLDGALCSPGAWLSFANNLPFRGSLVGVICLGPWSRRGPPLTRCLGRTMVITLAKDWQAQFWTVRCVALGCGFRLPITCHSGVRWLG